MVSMIAEPTLANTLETRPEKPIHWAVVLGTAAVVVLLMWIVGFLAGGLLHQGLMTWLAGPEAVHVLPENIAELPADARPLASVDGLILCSFLFAAPVGALLVRFGLVRRSAPAREYLGLERPGLQKGLRWGLLLLAVHLGCWLLDVYVLRTGSVAEDGAAAIARVPRLFPLVFLSVVILLPIFTELLARGYVLEGLRRSLGEVGAVLITAALWAAPLSEVSLPTAGLYINGIFLALARLRTGSIYPGLLAQVVINAVVVLSWANG